MNLARKPIMSAAQYKGAPAAYGRASGTEELSSTAETTCTGLNDVSIEVDPEFLRLWALAERYEAFVRDLEVSSHDATQIRTARRKASDLRDLAFRIP